MRLLTLFLVLVTYSTRADRITGQPSLNLNHVVTMNEASQILAGELQSVKPSGCRFVDRTGQTYGELTVLGYAGSNNRGQANWICRCSCGSEKVVFGGNLNSGHTLSCGCKKGRLTHGENRIGKRSVEYQTLAGIIQRCLNPKCEAYQGYGAKGITVCEEWNSMDKFPAFLAYMGRRPSPLHTVDRWPNKNGNYEPGNVRWADPFEQQGNTNKNVMVTYLGETICVRAMARKYNLSYGTLRYRLNHGWSVERSITTPSKTTQWNHS